MITRTVTVTVPGIAAGELRARLSFHAHRHPSFAWQAQVTPDVAADTDTFTCTADLPRLPGALTVWAVHTRGGITAVLPGLALDDVPASVRTAVGTATSPVCAHCGTRRAAHHLAVSTAERPDPFWVGLTCLRRMTGADSALGEHTALTDLTFDPAVIADQIVRETNSTGFLDTTSAIAAALHVVRTHGFMGIKAARASGLLSTAERVAALASRDRTTDAITWPEPIPSLMLSASLMQLWAMDQMQPRTDFEIEVQRAAARGRCSLRSLGLLSVLPVLYQRARDAEDAIAAGRPVPGTAYTPGYAGAVGERRTFPDAVVDMVRDLPAAGATVVVFRSAQGHRLSWFAHQGKAAVQVGQRVQLTGTIKAHAVVAGVEDTRLNRCVLR